MYVTDDDGYDNDDDNDDDDGDDALSSRFSEMETSLLSLLEIVAYGESCY